MLVVFKLQRLKRLGDVVTGDGTFTIFLVTPLEQADNVMVWIEESSDSYT